MWFLAAITIAFAIMLVSWRKESPSHVIDKQREESVLYKRSWASLYINGLCLKGMTTIEFRDTYLRLYQTFSRRIILRAKYEKISPETNEHFWVESYGVKTEKGEYCKIGFYKRDARTLQQIMAKCFHSIAGSARSE